MLKLAGKLLVAMPVLLAALWGLGALYYRLPLGLLGKTLLMAAFASVMLFALWAIFATRHQLLATACVVVAAALLLTWYQTIKPSDTLDWAPDVARRSLVIIENDDVVIRNMRNFEWHGAYEADARWEDRRLQLSDISSVDLALSYWTGPAIAHLMVSFGTTDGQYYVFSTEIRRQVDQKYSPIAGFFRSYTLDTIVAEESDLVKVRTSFRGEDVYLYRLDVMPETAQKLFATMAGLTQELERAPKFYNTVTANCSMAPFSMLSTLQPGVVPFDPRIVTVGYLPSYLYKHAFIDTRLSLEETIAAARITDKAIAAGALDGKAFSAAIRAP